MPPCCLQKPDIFKQLQQQEGADVFCLQETRLQQKHLKQHDIERRLQLPGWYMHWSCSQEPARPSCAVRLLSRKVGHCGSRSLDEQALCFCCMQGTALLSR